MSTRSLNDLEVLIKQLIQSQDALTQNLIKIDSLLQVALEGNFIKNSQDKLYAFLWTISDMTEISLSISEQQMNQLIMEEARLGHRGFI